MGTDEGHPNSSGRPKTPVEQWFELFVYAPLGFALDARQLLPRFIDRGRSQVVLARVVGRYAVEKGSTRAESYLGQSHDQVSAVLQAFGLLSDDRGPHVDQNDLDDFNEAVVSFERDQDDEPSARAPDAAEPADTPDVASLGIPDYDNLSASQVVPRLGGLSSAELEAVRHYEANKRGRKTILNKIAQLRAS
jgi:hypothetical protein